MAFGGPRSSCVRPGAHSARRLRSLAFLCSSLAIIPLKSKAESLSSLRDLKNSKDGISQGLLKLGNPGLRLKATPKRAS